MGAKLKDEYEKDFYLWAMHNAELIKQGKFSEIDIENVAEEIESMGKSEKRELLSRLAVLIAHLLKWQFQPVKQSHSWKMTIKEQRLKLKKLLQESPSLKHELESKISEAYEDALLIASRETGFLEETFPKKCPFNFAQCTRENFFP